MNKETQAIKHAFISGNHPLMGMLAMRFAKNHHVVKIAEDQNVLWNKQFLEQITELDKAFFESWGIDENVRCLQNIDQYIYKHEVSFIFNGVALYLGGNPSRNLIELSRKFSSLFSEKAIEEIEHIFQDKNIRNLFDDRFVSLAKRISLNCFRYRTLETLTPAIFETHCPENIKHLFRDFYENLFKDKHRSLILGLNAFYHNSMTLRIGELEAIHLFLSLLSPIYKFDFERFYFDLSEELKSAGVGYLTHDKKYQVIKNKLFPYLDGEKKKLPPTKSFLFGEREIDRELSIFKENYCYEKYEINITNVDTIELALGRYIIVHDELLGTNIPFWSLELEHNNVLNVHFYYKKESCDHLRKRESLVKDFLSQEFLSFGIDLRSANFSEIKKSYSTIPLEWAKFEMRKENCKLPLVSCVYFRKETGKEVKVSNAWGFSSERFEPLGLYSLLLQLKNIDSFNL